MGDPELQLPDGDLELGQLDLEMLAELGFVLDLLVQFVPGCLNDPLLLVQALGHCRQLVLVIILQRVQVSMPQLCELALQCLALQLVAFLIALDNLLQVADLQSEVIALSLVLEPEILYLHVQLHHLVGPNLVGFGQLLVLLLEGLVDLAMHVVSVL